MSDVNLKAAIEAILFATGSAIEENKLLQALGTEEDPINKKDFLKAVDELEKSYEDQDRGIRLLRLESKYQLCTKNEYFEVLGRIVNMPKKHSLTDTLLETLAIVAYKQPVTRAEIEKIRGVSCSHVVNRLVEYNLICEVGRLDAPGHPILFGTTDDFLRNFGISSMDELPGISQDKIEDFRKQAEKEAGLEGSEGDENTSDTDSDIDTDSEDIDADELDIDTDMESEEMGDSSEEDMLDPEFEKDPNDYGVEGFSVDSDDGE
ncbi:MAG: SMC-Scp complex subunit ScpB [Eubacterium sp.]|nr:SMC-Scp complex subunit ScpB [Eubacterium sp.]